MARRRLRLALRQAREAKGLTQAQVADELDWSLSKVNRIEKGEVTISTTDLRALLSLLDINAATDVQRLVDDAKASRRRGWWDDPAHRERLTPALLQLIQFEEQATIIREFEPTLVPGLLQTRSYAKAIMDFWADELPPAVRDARLEVRMLRGGQVLDQPDPPSYLVLLDESVIYREIGGREVLAGQLNELVRRAEQPRITVRILPFAKRAGAAGMTGPFVSIDLGDEENAVLYRESPMGDELVHSPEMIRTYRSRFETIWAAALSEKESIRLIQEFAEGLPKQPS